MSSDRGSYRSIARVLIDGPDFQQLTPQARHVFLTLKIGMGPAGIEVRYPGSLLDELRHQTGYTDAVLNRAMRELVKNGWLKREGHVLWIVDQLRYEPSLQPSNGKHRKAIMQHLSGLPRTRIVAEFADYYRWFIDDADTLIQACLTQKDAQSTAKTSAGNTIPETRDSLSIGYPESQESQKTEDRRQKTEDRKKKNLMDDDADFGRAWARYPKRHGGSPKDKAWHAWQARLREGVSPGELLAGVERYRAYCDAEGKTGGPYVMQAARFFGPGREYAQSWAAEDPMPPRYIDDDPRKDNPEWFAWDERQQRRQPARAAG